MVDEERRGEGEPHPMSAIFSLAYFTFSRITSIKSGKKSSISIFRRTRFRCAVHIPPFHNANWFETQLTSLDCISIWTIKIESKGEGGKWNGRKEAICTCHTFFLSYFGWLIIFTSIRNTWVLTHKWDCTCSFLDLIFAFSRAMSRHKANVCDKLQYCSA